MPNYTDNLAAIDAKLAVNARRIDECWTVVHIAIAEILGCYAAADELLGERMLILDDGR